MIDPDISMKYNTQKEKHRSNTEKAAADFETTASSSTPSESLFITWGRREVEKGPAANDYRLSKKNPIFWMGLLPREVSSFT
ncbi:hypothetical protein AVEN_218191-1 [Araneus ventricosus]|uniref:Uncharacterized protein n=1 Tax=Araneus ventricosus TaxID=182803 RepID=A0A4Y2F6Z1_ARAVE|nr:hypothetical protein AVEN_218191-1 [Araneus ventricosus]